MKIIIHEVLLTIYSKLFKFIFSRIFNELFDCFTFYHISKYIYFYERIMNLNNKKISTFY